MAEENIEYLRKELLDLVSNQDSDNEDEDEHIKVTSYVVDVTGSLGVWGITPCHYL